MVRLAADDTVVAFAPERARLSVHDGGRELAAGTVAVALGDRVFPETDAYEVETDRDGVVVRYDDDANTRVVLTRADGAVDVRVDVEPAGDDAVSLGDVRPLAGTDTAFGPSTDVYRHGYQSWSPTGTLPVDEGFPPEAPANVPMMTDLAAPEVTSHGLLGLTGEDRRLTLGFLDHGSYVARFDLETGDDGLASLSAVCPGDGVALSPGETARSATLRVDATRPVADALRALADAVADRMDARVPERAPTGWCSWYHYFTDVTPADVRENLAAVADWDPPVELVQLDDGYQTAFGDWLTLTDAFERAGMADLVADVTDRGYRPGLWLAPFLVQEDAALVADHPEWLLSDDGEPVTAGRRHGEMYGLDTTHPGVQDWLADTVGTVTDDWGFSYLKLDFLYAAALPADRHGDATRAEAYRRGLATIRDAAGEDTFLLGCGAPQCQSVGLVDAMRVGPDTAPFWADPDDAASEPAHENAVRNVLNRQFTHRRWWLTDPDCQLVRATTDLSPAERETFATLVALSGGTNVFSDAVAEISPAGRELLERSLPPVSGGTVDGLGSAEFPDSITCRRPADGGRAVAVFNWADEQRTVTCPLADGERAWNVSRERPVPAGGAATASVPPHGRLLVHAAPASERPHVLGATHLAAGTDQLTRTRFRRRGATGELTLQVEAPRSMEFLVAVPSGWRVPADGPPTVVDVGAAGAAGAADAADAPFGVARVAAEPGATTVAFERRQ